MKIIDTDELKVLQTDVLEAIHGFCEKQGIKYTMGCGTLLGAVRHKGYIPWDDDIDIYLLREDYERLMKSFPPLYDGKYKLVSLERDAAWERPYAKAYDNRTVFRENAAYKYVIGVGIDVYPIDNVPDDESEWVDYNRKRLFFQRLFQMKFIRLNKSRSLWKNMLLVIVKGVLLPVSPSRFARFLDRYARKYNNASTRFVFENVQGVCVRRRFRKDVFLDIEDMSFEDRHFNGLKDYDEYLRNAYGNYMQLPPEEKRVPHHDFIAGWK